MAVAYQSSVKIASDLGGGSGSVSATVPTGLTTDNTWVIVGCDDNNGSDGNINVPTNFTAVDAGHRSGSGFPFQRAFWKNAGASESAVSVPFLSGTYECSVHSIRLSGAHTTAPIGNITNTSGGTTSSTTITPTAITIQNNGSLALLTVAGYISAATTTITKPATATAIQSDTTSSYKHLGTAYELVNTGTYSPGAWTYSNSHANKTATTIEIIPASTGSTISGDGSATGTGAATGTGQSQYRATGSTAGASTVTGGGGALSRATGSIDGVGAVSSTGQSLFVSTGTIAGVGSASGASSSASTAAGAGSSGGTGAATAVGRSTAISGASSTGSSTVTGTGKALAVILGSTSGTSTASGTTKALFTADGLSSGFGQASAVPEGVEAVTATPYPSKRRRRHG